jgi:AsmA protein
LNKPLKIGAIVIAIVIALLALIVILTTVLIDPNRYRDEIIQVVKTQTGRDLKIDGDLKLSFFPWLGLQTGKLQLSNAPGFGAEPFARVDMAGVSVELLPLLRKEVRVDKIRLKGLKLNLARAADGRTNWDDMTRAKAESKPAEPAKKSEPSAALAAFSVNKLDVRDADFTWRDQAAGSAYALHRVELTSGNLIGSSPVPLHLAFDLESTKPKITRRIELDAKLNVDLATEKLNAPDVRLSAGDLKIQAQLRGTEMLHAPKINGRIEMPPFNLRALLQELQIAYAPTDANVLKKVGLAAQVDYGAQAVAISDLRLTLDDTALTGKFALQQKPHTAYRFDLAVDAIDVDRYLPPSAKTGEDKAAGKGKGGEAVVIPLALLREADADGQLRVQKLKASGIRSEQVVVKVAAHGGRIVLGPNEARLYSGTYAGNTSIDASGPTPRFQFDEKLSGVQLGPFLKDAQLFDKFTGAGNVTLALTARGFDADAIKRTLNGSVAVAINNGAIEGIDLEKIEAKIKAIKDQPGGTGKNLLTSLPALSPEKGDKTAFSKLQASAKITNGVVANRDLAIEAPHVRVTGSGDINLVTNKYEKYVLRVNNIPFILDGPLDSTLPKPNLSGLVKEQTEQRVEKAKEEAKDKAVDKLRDRLRERLKR